MASLTNTNQELFCIGVASGMNKSKAYLEAYNCNPNTAGKQGSILAKLPHIHSRISELVEQRTKFQQNVVGGDADAKEVIDSGIVTKEWLVTVLVTAIPEAKAANQFGAVAQYVKLLAELGGFLGKAAPEDNTKAQIEDTKAISVARVNKFLSSSKIVDVT